MNAQTVLLVAGVIILGGSRLLVTFCGGPYRCDE